MRIGELARRTGVTTRRLRYYEQQALLDADRNSNAYRDYDDCAVDRVRQIRDLLDAGLPVRVIRVLLPHMHEPDTDLPRRRDAGIAHLLRRELDGLDARIEQLSRTRGEVRCLLDRVT